MKLNKFLVVAATLGLAANAFAADVKNEGQGTVNFKGSIIDAPCSIDPNSQDREVNLGQVSNALLADGGKSNPVPFSIELTNCTTATKQTVTATFTGAASVGNADLLGITGTASGASVAIVDGSGALIKLGSATKPQTLANGGNVLAFSAYLQGDTATGATITPGDFTATASYALSYQ